MKGCDGMANEKKSFLLYFDNMDCLRELEDAERGKLLMALVHYAQELCKREHDPKEALEQHPELSPAACMAFLFMAGNIYRDTHKWLERQRKQQEAARRRVAQQNGALFPLKKRKEELAGEPWGAF